MIYTYEELLKKKEKGEKLDWNNISKDQLMKLFFEENISDRLIADLYGVTKGKVTYKRNKVEVTFNSKDYYNLAYEAIKKEHPELINNAKNNLLRESNIESVSIALTHYLFRNGPVEDIHENGQLSQEDMKTLNKYMVNRIAGLLKMIHNNDWIKLELLLEYNSRYGKDWDKVECDTSEADRLYEMLCSRK